MKIVAIKTFLLSILLFTLSHAQDDKIEIEGLNDCPPLYTRSEIRNPKIEIIKFEVIDSNKYSSLPMSVINFNSLSKLFVYPEIAKRAGVEGNVIVKVLIEPNGKVSKTEIIKGIGGGCDESILDVLLKIEFNPAKIYNQIVTSEIITWVNFSLIDVFDKPDYLFDEIIYEEEGLGYYTKLSLKKNNRATIYERINHKIQPYKFGKIPSGLYTKLSDFIISQCFLNYEYSYSSLSLPHTMQKTITVKIGPTDKSVSTYGYDGDPIGLWAITKVIEKLQDDIKWGRID